MPETIRVVVAAAPGASPVARWAGPAGRLKGTRGGGWLHLVWLRDGGGRQGESDDPPDRILAGHRDERRHREDPHDVQRHRWAKVWCTDMDDGTAEVHRGEHERAVGLPGAAVRMRSRQ